MNTAALKKITIMHELSRIPEARLDTVITYIESLLRDVPVPQSQNTSLKGIWKETGLDKISDIEGELRTVRHELQHAILERKL